MGCGASAGAPAGAPTGAPTGAAGLPKAKDDNFNPPERPAAKDTKLPLQLSRLPEGHIKRASAALNFLKSCGLEKADNLQDLQDKVAKLLDKIDTSTTTNELQSRWCQTRTVWRKVDRIDPQANCKLEGLTDQQCAAKCQELENAQKKEREAADDSSIQQAMDEMRKKIENKVAPLIEIGNNWDVRDETNGTRPRHHREHFEAWVESQIAAAHDLRLLASDSGFVPKFLGTGRKALFASVSGNETKATTKAKNAIPSVTVTPWEDMIKEPSENDSREARLAKKVFAGSRPGIITAHVGSAGCMIAESYWNQLISEHVINSDGTYTKDPIGCIASSFDEKPKGSLLPRTVLVDTANNNVNLPGCIKQEEVTRHNGSVTNWAAMYMDEHHAVIDATMEKMRLQLEKCDAVNSVLLTYAIYEEFGGAISARLLERLQAELPKTVVWAFPLVPVRDKASASSIYNTVFGFSSAHENCTLVTCADQSSASAGGKPSQEHRMAQVLATCSAPLRLNSAIPASEGSLRVSPSTMASILCPYPRANWTFPVCSMAVCDYTSDYLTKQDQKLALYSSFQKGNLLSQNVSTEEGKYMSIGLYFRNTCSPQKTIAMLKCHRSFRFVDWAPTGFQVAWHSESIPNRSPLEKQIVGICNSTCFKGALDGWACLFDENMDELKEWQQYDIHGIEDGFARECREKVASACKDFEEMGADTE